MWCRSAFPRFSVAGQLIGSIRSDSSVRSTFFSSSRSRPPALRWSVGQCALRVRIFADVASWRVASRVQCVRRLCRRCWRRHRMPSLIAFGRRWRVGSDDLVLPGAVLFYTHLLEWVSCHFVPFFRLVRICSFESNVTEGKGSGKVIWKFHARNLKDVLDLSSK